MRVCVAGLDFLAAPLEIRERFSFNATAPLDFLTKLKAVNTDGVLLSTCNRMVLWTYGEQSSEELLRAERGAADFISLTGKPALRYLYEVAAGLRSQVPLEEQIIGQLKNSLNQARAAGSSGAVLDHLFLSAISAGKEVRTKLVKYRETTSVARLAIDKCGLEQGTLQDKSALIIGGGEMGMFCASLLLDRGARVMMTRRKPRNDGISMPEAVEPIPYEERYQALAGCDVVISATACPSYVLRAADVGLLNRDLLVLDIAVPRDVEPSIGDIPRVRLFDIDSIGYGELDSIVRQRAEKILERHMKRFNEWARLRSCKPLFDEIHSYFEREFTTELGRPEDEDKIKIAVRRITDKLLFSLRDKVELDKAVELYTVLAKAARG